MQIGELKLVCPKRVRIRQSSPRHYRSWGAFKDLSQIYHCSKKRGKSKETKKNNRRITETENKTQKKMLNFDLNWTDYITLFLNVFSPLNLHAFNIYILLFYKSSSQPYIHLKKTEKDRNIHRYTKSIKYIESTIIFPIHVSIFSFFSFFFVTAPDPRTLCF